MILVTILLALGIYSIVLIWKSEANKDRKIEISSITFAFMVILILQELTIVTHEAHLHATKERLEDIYTTIEQIAEESKK